MEQFLVDNSLYVVLAVVLIIWFGIGAFLMFINGKLTKLEKETENLLGKEND